MNRRIRSILTAVVTSLAGATLSALQPASSSVHVVTADNLFCGGEAGEDCFLTLFDEGRAREEFTWRLATHNWNPPGLAGVYFSHALSQSWVLATATGELYDQNALNVALENDFPLGAAFNVFAAPETDCFGVHLAFGTNLSGDTTFLDRPALNGHPEAFLLVLELSAASPRHVGVFYDTGPDRWGIFNLDHSAMAEFREFVVYDGSCEMGLGAEQLIACSTPTSHVCSLGSIGEGDPGARLLVTTVLSEETLIENPHPIGVYYNHSASRWFVFNEDFANMPTGALFHVAEIELLHLDGFESGDLLGWTFFP